MPSLPSDTPNPNDPDHEARPGNASAFGGKPAATEGLAARLAKLSPAQRRLLEQRLQSRAAVAEPIAVVGMGCRLPGARSVEAFWELIRDGIDATSDVPPSRWDLEELYDPSGTQPGKMSVRRGAFVDDVDRFDATFFGIAPREASRMDPQQRILLEVAWETLERSGIAPRDLAGSRTGVYIGIGGTDYSKIPAQQPDYLEHIDAHVGTGNALSVAAGRLSYIFDFHGPSFAVDTACSSALVALHSAVQALRAGECDGALAGGVNLILSPEVTIAFSKARMLSPDGRCRPFDVDANGYVRGEGCALVYLKRLRDAQADGDTVLGVIRGTAINQDGKTSGITAPSSHAQREVIRAALRQAGVRPEEISYIEAHGTGTPLGDPIEFQSLCEIYARRAADERPVYVTSAKANIGHTETVSGMAGLLKVLLMLQHGEILPQLHLQRLNPHIKLDRTRLAIPHEPVPWPAGNGRRIAGVSSFGFGGTNAHLILEEPEPPRADAPAGETGEANGQGANGQPAADAPPVRLLPVSAHTDAALQELAARWADHLDAHLELEIGDACRTASVGRNHFSHRGAVVARDRGELIEGLRSIAEDRSAGGSAAGGPRVRRGKASTAGAPRFGFLFTGQGAQYAGMGRGLYEAHPVFRQAIDRASEVLDPLLPRPLRDVLFDADASAEIDQTQFTQPALVALEMALCELWKSWGVRPDIVAGHSVGEYAAAWAAGVMDFDAALRLIAARGRLMQRLPAGGAMAAVLAPPERVEKLLVDETGVCIAAYNGPENTVVSGDADAVERLAARCATQDIVAKPLVVSHAFHSQRMDPILEEFHREAASLEFSRPRIPLLSNLTGRAMDEAPTAEYWTEHLRRAVRFTECGRAMLETGVDVVIEVGPAPQLTGMMRRIIVADASPPTWLASLRRGAEDWQTLLTAVAEGYCAGLPLDWRRFGDPWPGRRVTLPTYPFARDRYWFDFDTGGTAAGTRHKAVHPLLGAPVDAAVEHRLFEAVLRCDRPAYLADHVVQGSVVVPGAAFLEIGLAATRQVFPGDGQPRVESFVIQHPLFLSDSGGRQVQTLIEPERNGRATFQVFSRDAAERNRGWTLHARGALLRDTSADDERAPRGDEVRQVLADTVDVKSREAFYDIVEARGLTYGGAFRVLESIHRTRDAATAALADSAAGELTAEDSVHPTLLDGCMQMMAAIVPLEPNGDYNPNTFMPVAVGELAVHGAGRPSRILARRTAPGDDRPDPELVEGDVAILDEEDRELVTLRGVQVRRASGRGAADHGPATSRWLYGVAWETAEAAQPASANAQENGKPRAAAQGEPWLVVGAAAPTRDAVAEHLRAAGCEVRFCNADAVQRIEDGAARLEGDGAPAVRGVLLLASGLDRADDEDVAAAAGRDCHRLMHLVQAAVRRSDGVPRVAVATCGAEPVGGDGDVRDVAGAAMWGMGRTAQVEHPELALRLIDLDPEANAEQRAAALAAELLAGADEDQVGYRGEVRYAARLRPAPEAIDGEGAAGADGPLVVPSGGPYRLRLDGSNRIDGLWLERSGRLPPEAGKVELEIEAAGLNFSDVLKAMGLYPGITDAVVPLGIECAGVVTAVGEGVTRFQPGDRVLGVAPYSFASHAVTTEYALAPCPRFLTAEEAATIPITFLTAHYALVRLADLQPGERVLIHAAAGGVGLAAIQIAQQIGAEVFATAGSDGKRDFLRALGVQNIFSSRTLEFADQIRAETGGAGVDVVLNSLPGEAIDRSLSVLAPYGRFLEIGKTDIYQNRMIGLQPFQDNLSYFAIDLDRVLRQRPPLVRRLFGEVMARIEAGDYQPLPVTTFPIAGIRDAFRYMAQRKNIGKVVVDLRTATSDAADDEDAIAGRGTHLITGGLGALGLQVAGTLADQGATHLALLARRPPSEAAERAISALRERGTEVAVLRGDVADADSLAAALGSLPDGFPPLRGVVHAAGALCDHVLYDMTDEQLDRALAPKIAGAWNLHDATQEQPLAYFAFFSSIAGLFGSPGQANYAAGNAFLDALAHYRRRRGLPAVALCWGPWADAGMAAAEGRQANVTGRGLQLLPAAAALGVMSASLRGGPPQLAVVDARWSEMFAGRAPGSLPSLLRGPAESVEGAAGGEGGGVDAQLRGELLALSPAERIPRLRTYFAEQLGAIMGLAVDRIEPEQSLGAMGLDSLMAIELKNTIETRLQVVLPMARFMEGPSLQNLAEQVAELLGETQDVALVESSEPAAETGRHALSHGQRALWFLNQLAPQSTAYNICDAVRVHGPLDADVLQQSVQRIVDRHEAFRTVFEAEHGRPVARVHESLQIPVEIVDARGWDAGRLRQAIHAEAHRPFDLRTGPLMRVRAWRESDDRHVLFFAVHHIIADFWSLVSCTDEFRTTYAALRRGDPVEIEPPSHQYRHFVSWQQRMLESPEGERHKAYWLKRLAGELPTLELPTDRPRPPFQTFRGGLAFRWLPAELTERLKRMAAAHGMTLNMVLLAGYQLLLHRLSGQEDVLVGLPTSGRSRAELTDVVGYFVNPAVVRSRLDGQLTVPEYLERTRQATLGALEHQDYPLPLLVDDLHPERDPSRSTLFQALFVMQKAQILHGEGLTPFLMGQSGATLDVADLVFESMTLDQWVAQFDLSLAASEADGGTSLGLQYNSDLFDHATAEQLLERFARVMESLLEHADAPLDAVSVVDAEERQRLVEVWGDGGAAPEDLEPVHRMFERQAAETPERVAVVCAAERMRYGDLNAAANRIAHSLIAAGVRPGDRVGVCLPRGVSLVAAMLGVLKAGAAYVPLDPKYPPARLRRIIGGTRMAAVVTDAPLADSLSEAAERLLCVDRPETLVDETGDPAVAVGLDDLIYVIYTSGSTGEPKGAGVSHRGFANLVRWYVERLDVSERDAFLVVTSHGFDLTQKNFFAPLVTGGRLQLSAGEAFDPEVVGREVQEGDVTVLNCTPSNLYPLIEHGANLSERRLRALRWVVLGGEPIDRGRLRPWLDQPWCDAAVVNSYGPTECSDVVAYHVLEWESQRGTGVPIGRPIPAARLYVLDARRQPVPAGVTGQLYVGGICVGAGYVNDAAMTAEKFVADPFAEDAEARMYATGDQCRWRNDGQLEFMGRADDQVKIRGHRIELGEVEAAIGELAAVRDVAVIVREDTPGRKRLVAYVVADSELSAEGVLSELRAVLPPQSIPAAVVQLERLPLTPHGKLDRRGLPAPGDGDSLASAGYVAPRNEREQAVVAVWSDVLDVERVGAHDNFFALGGDSLLAIQVVARLGEAGWKCTPAQLLMRQTAAALAEVLTEAAAGEEATSEQPVEGPLLPMQQGWADQRLRHPDHFNMSVAVSTPSGLDAALLGAAVREVARRHEALRTRFEQTRDGWRQVVDPEPREDLLETVALPTESPREAERSLGRITARMHAALDPRCGATARFAHVDFGTALGGRLVLVAHHLVSDPISLRVLLEDLLAAYQAGGAIASEPPRIGPVAWATMLEQRTRAGEFDGQCADWLEMAERPAPPIAVEVPLEEGEEDTVADAAVVEARLEAETAERLVQRTRPGEMPALLLGGFLEGLRPWGGGGDFVRVDVETTGRRVDGVDLGRSVGWFVSTFPVDVSCPDGAEPAAMFDAARAALAGIEEDGVGYGALRCYGDDATRARLREADAASVRFNYLGKLKQRTRGTDALIREAPEELGANIHPANRRMHAIEVDIWIAEDGALVIRLTHGRRHRSETVRQWMRAMTAWLENFAATEDAVDTAPAVEYGVRD